jgi:DNA-binding transcriptional regulator YhcF (GntR family)
VDVIRVQVDPAGAVAPYEQVRSQLGAGIADGTLEAGQRLPTVRRLAADLGLAVNTVARAYRELEADGLVVTQGRRGTFVRSGALEAASEPAAAGAAQDYCAAARRLGLTLAEATRLVERSWPRS